GSKYLVEANGKRLLVDCGLFQGGKELRERNWVHSPQDPAAVDWVLLTHAHLDHTGYLPRLLADGFRGPIFANAATRELCALLLPDSGHLMEEDAADAARNHPADPPAEQALADVINRVAKRGGVIVVPAFAVDRTQLLMYYVRKLEDSNRIPKLPVYTDSPMAINVSDIYLRHEEDCQPQ